jgi:hypothetical protein
MHLAIVTTGVSGSTQVIPLCMASLTFMAGSLCVLRKLILIEVQQSGLMQINLETRLLERAQNSWLICVKQIVADRKVEMWRLEGPGV